MRQILWLLLALLLFPAEVPAQGSATDGAGVPILLYHRLGDAADTMTISPRVFASQLEYLKANGYTVIPLRRLVAYLAGDASPPPPHSVVVTVDDGHGSVFTEMFPLIRSSEVPVTLFIYPSAISNAKYAMTWSQLRQMQDSGLVDIQSHTYWHPNFKKEKKRLSGSAYQEFVREQMTKSKEVLERKLGKRIDMLAWPFGIYDDELITMARRCGYVAGFALERRHARPSDNIMALPRYLVTDKMNGTRFGKVLGSP